MICSSDLYCFLCSVPVGYLGYRKRLQHTPGICLGALGYLYTKAKYTCYSAATLSYTMRILITFYIRKVTQMARRPSSTLATAKKKCRSRDLWPELALVLCIIPIFSFSKLIKLCEIFLDMGNMFRNKPLLWVETYPKMGSLVCLENRLPSDILTRDHVIGTFFLPWLGC